jgi:glycosyltransferase involved in cell wall biosynthesis
VRILHCIPSLAGGGAERQIASLAEGFVRKGDAVFVAALYDGVRREALARSGVVVEMIEGSGNNDPRIVWRLFQLMKRLRPDVVQTWLQQMDVMAGAAAILAGIPWVLSERSSALAYVRTSLKERLRRAFARRASAIVANSNAGLEYWRDVAPQRILRATVRNAVPVHDIDAALPADIATGKALILFVGRLNREKNVPTLLAAFARVAAHTDAVLAICGDGPDAEELRKQIDALGIADRVLLPGYVADVWRWMHRADVFVSVSFFEGNPNATLEAAAAGVPLVVSDVPAHREFLGDDAALFVDPYSIGDVADAIVGTLADRGAAASRAARAREVVCRWSVDAAVAQYDAVYRHAAGR